MMKASTLRPACRKNSSKIASIKDFFRKSRLRCPDSTHVESESSGGTHDLQHPREGQTQDESPSETDGDGETHPDLSLREGEDLGRISERDGTFTGRVKGGEEEDEGGDCS